METEVNVPEPLVIERPEHTEIWCRREEIPVVGAALRALTGQPAELISVDIDTSIFTVTGIDLHQGCELLRLVRGGWPPEEINRSVLSFRVSLARQLESREPRLSL